MTDTPEVQADGRILPDGLPESKYLEERAGDFYWQSYRFDHDILAANLEAERNTVDRLRAELAARPVRVASREYETEVFTAPDGEKAIRVIDVRAEKQKAHWSGLALTDEEMDAVYVEPDEDSDD
jgi:hypothetical protein